MAITCNGKNMAITCNEKITLRKILITEKELILILKN